MKKSRSILLVGSQHGNELLGEQLYDYIRTQAHRYSVDYILANPLARHRNTRHIESDMNRSYVPTVTTYEERQADILLQYIRNNAYDLVIDAHTTTIHQEPCIILPALNDANQSYVRASHIANVVVMQHPFVTRSLIGQHVHAVSVEISVSQVTLELLQKLTDDLERYITDTSALATKNVFTVTDLFLKDEIEQYELGQLENFKQMADGRYPVLMGEDAYRKYTDYLGFVAQTKEVIKV